MEIACDEVRAEFSESFASWVTHGGVLLPPLRTTQKGFCHYSKSHHDLIQTRPKDVGSRTE